MNRSYLYTAAGDEHVEEAIISVESLRKYNPSAHIRLVTNSERQDLGKVFDEVVYRDGPSSIEYKVKHLRPISKYTCYVDTDTYFTSNVDPVFDVLNAFDFAMMLDPVEIEMFPGITAYNTGVVFFNDSETVQSVLEYLEKEYLSDPQYIQNHPARKQRTDQPYLMKAIMNYEVKVHSLPSNYNFRYRFPVSIMGTAQIIHGPKPACGWERLAAKINKTTEPRVWTRSMVNGE